MNASPIRRVTLLAYSHEPHTTPVYCTGCGKRLPVGSVANETPGGFLFCDSCCPQLARVEDGDRQLCRGALECGLPSHSCDTYTTLKYPDGRRFHFCDEHPYERNAGGAR